MLGLIMHLTLFSTDWIIESEHHIKPIRLLLRASSSKAFGTISSCMRIYY